MALTNLQANVSLDLYDHDSAKPVIKAIALDNDTRYVLANITYRGARYDIGSSPSVQLIVIRPDKVGVQVIGQPQEIVIGVEDDTPVTVYGAYAELDQAALAISGTLLGQFKITSGDQILRTQIFQILNGEALDSDTWAGDYDGYNLDDLVETVNEVSEAANGVINMTVSSQTLPQGASATVTKTEDEDGIINLDFGLPLASGEVQVVNVSGSNPSITAEYNKRYVCGEVSTLTITPASQGCTDVLFTSGTTPTVLSLPQTVKMPSWFSVEASKTYEINILDGVYGSVMAWT